MELSVCKLISINGRSRLRRFTNIDYSHLSTINGFDGLEDIRFTLFNRGAKVMHTLLLDFDGLSMEKGKDLITTVQKVYGEHLMFHVFTGGGHHIYIPMDVGLEKANLCHYKESYISKASELQAMFDDTVIVDVLVFNSVEKFGRVPGSFNSKHKKTVVYMGEDLKSPLAKSIDTLLDFNEVTYALKKNTFLDNRIKDNGGRNPWKFCAFVRYADRAQAALPYNLWQMAVSILGNAGQFDEARQVSEDHEDYDENTFDGQAQELAKYNYGCARVFDETKDVMDSPCLGCPHHGTGSFPSYVSGVNITPSAKTGFHPLVKSGEDFVLNKKRIEPVDVVHQMVNTSNLILCDGMVYEWGETYWEQRCSFGSSVSLLSENFMDRLEAIPAHKLRTHTDIFNLFRVLPSMTSKLSKIKRDDLPNNLINFTNGILDLDSNEFMDHEKESYQFMKPAHQYLPDATCPAWDAFLERTFSNEEQIHLLHVFMGLALSNVPLSEYQEMLWMNGRPRSGKSTILRVFRALVGVSNTIGCVGGAPPIKDGSLAMEYRRKRLFAIDEFSTNIRRADLNAWERILTPFVSGVSIGVRLMRQEVIHSEPEATVIITSNDDPPFNEKGDGLGRRIRVLPFEMGVEKKDEDRYLFRKFQAEMPGIMNKALVGLASFQEYGMPERSEGEQLEVDLLYDEGVSAEIQTFFDKYLTPAKSREESTKMSELHTLYCRVNNKDTSFYGVRRFGQQFKKFIKNQSPYKVHEVYNRRPDGQYVRFKLKI